MEESSQTQATDEPVQQRGASRKAVIKRLLGERESVQREARSQTVAAEAISADLREEVATLTAQLGQRDANIAELQARLEEQAAEVERLEFEVSRSAESQPEDRASALNDDDAARFLQQELAAILEQGKRAASQLLERAQRAAEEQTAEAMLTWERLEADRAAFDAWMGQAAPHIEATRSKVEDVRRSIKQAPDRIQEALAVLRETVAAVDLELEELQSVPMPPELVNPKSLDLPGIGEKGSTPGEPPAVVEDEPDEEFEDLMEEASEEEASEEETTPAIELSEDGGDDTTATDAVTVVLAEESEQATARSA